MNREKLAALKVEWTPVYEAEQRRTYFRPTDTATVLFHVMKVLDALLEGGDCGPDDGHDAERDRAIDALGRSVRRLDERLTAVEEGRAAGRGYDQMLDQAFLGLRSRVEALEALNSQPRLTSLEVRVKGVDDLTLVLNRDLQIQEQKVEALEAYRAGHDAYDLEVHGSLKALEGHAAEAAEQWLRLASLQEEWKPRPGAAVPASIYAFLALLDALLGPPDVGHGATLTDEAFTARLRSGQPWMNEWRRATEKVATEMASPKRGATPCPVCGSTICLGDPKACDQRAAARKAKP